MHVSNMRSAVKAVLLKRVLVSERNVVTKDIDCAHWRKTIVVMEARDQQWGSGAVAQALSQDFWSGGA